MPGTEETRLLDAIAATGPQNKTLCADDRRRERQRPEPRHDDGDPDVPPRQPAWEKL